MIAKDAEWVPPVYVSYSIQVQQCGCQPRPNSTPFGFHEQRSCTVLFTLEIDIAQFLVILF